MMTVVTLASTQPILVGETWLLRTTQAISQMSIVIDKMHMAGHVDAWCKENCDPHKFRDLDKVCFQLMFAVIVLKQHKHLSSNSSC